MHSRTIPPSLLGRVRWGRGKGFFTIVLHLLTTAIGTRPTEHGDAAIWSAFWGLRQRR